MITFFGERKHIVYNTIEYIIRGISSTDAISITRLVNLYALFTNRSFHIKPEL